MSGPYPPFGDGPAPSTQALGEICIWPVGRVPTGWAACDGHAVPIAQNTALYAILGATFGGQPNVTFIRPGSRRRSRGCST